MACTSTELRAVQDYYGFESAAPVEKDWHVTRVLAIVAATVKDMGPAVSPRQAFPYRGSTFLDQEAAEETD